MQVSNKYLKIFPFSILIVIIILLISATIIEKITGDNSIYRSLIMIILWIGLAISSIIILFKFSVYKQFFTFALHMSFVMILSGAFITHIFGVQGRLHLIKGDSPTNIYYDKQGNKLELPFEVELRSFNLEYYKGTFSPMDYKSKVRIIERGTETEKLEISMNNIGKYKNYRFYQSGYDSKGTILSISYDPYGIAVTYLGYVSLLISMLLFFFQKKSSFMYFLKMQKTIKLLVLGIFLLSSNIANSANKPNALNRDVADAFCDLYVYYNDRICPLQTLAKDFTIKVYGKTTYKGLTSEQVLTGWFFYYDEWKNEKMIKIKDKYTRKLLDIDGKYAALSDYTNIHGFKLAESLKNGDGGNGVNLANEKFNLISMLCTGSILKIYPYKNIKDSVSIWYSFADDIPIEMDNDEWIFVRNSMSYVAETIALNNTQESIKLLSKIKKYQEKQATILPSATKFKAEKIYNRYNYNKIIAMLCVTIGLLLFVLSIRKILGEKSWKSVEITMLIILSIVFVYLTMHIILRGYISGHIPLSNGFETMIFMAWCTCLITFIIRQKFIMAMPFGFLLSGLTMMVAMMGESNPKITNLMPVLQSPLLSIHVMVIMLAYSLFAFMLLNGVTALILNILKKDSKQEVEYLSIISHIMIYPAVFLLTIGVFIGAVWANVSWGRYWGWDPKEVWALITMLIYSFGLHSKVFKWVNNPITFHCFCILAFMAVLITYFGVNFLLGGKHSYA